MTLENFVSLIAKNNKGEQEALEGYYQLLSAIKENGLPIELYRQVSEIISDELNHTIVLDDWITKLSSIKPNES